MLIPGNDDVRIRLERTLQDAIIRLISKNVEINAGF